MSFVLEYYPDMEGYYYLDLIDYLVREEFTGFLKLFSKISSVEVSITLLLGAESRGS